MKFRHPYDDMQDEVSRMTGFSSDLPSKTKQSFKEEVDINTIVRRFNLTGQLPTDVRAPQYADFEEVFDFQSAMNAIVAAHESFDQMPSGVRARFHNDPQEFLEFCSNVDNAEEMVKMGLAVKRDPPPNQPDSAASTVST